MNENTEIFVEIEHHKHPKAKIKTEDRHIKIEYRQIAYDNRYVFIYQKDSDNEWQRIAKVADLEIAHMFIAGLINLVPEDEDDTITEKFSDFWVKVHLYDELLDSCDE